MKTNKEMRTAAQISNIVLYVLIGITVVLFAAFFFIGYDRPFADNPSFNAPLFTNVLLTFVSLLMLVAIGMGGWMIVNSMKRRNKEEFISNGIPVVRNAFLLMAATVLLLLLTFVLGSSSTIQINGKPFTDVFWLKVADMFVWSSVVLMLVAVGVVVYGYVRNQRKEKV